MRSRAPLVATVILLLVSGVMATPHSPGCGETTAFAAPQRPYVAFRRLEAENQKSGRQGWLDVRTELGTDGLLTVEVLDEGGSDYIRNKVLRVALDGERQLIATVRLGRFRPSTRRPAPSRRSMPPSMPPAWCAYR